MPISMQTALRRGMIAACLFAGVLLAVAPASADHGRRYRHYSSHRPHVAVFVGLPPIVLHAGYPRYREPYYRDERGYRDDYAYEEGYGDGYDDRAREEWWRREHYRRHRHHDHHDCDD